MSDYVNLNETGALSKAGQGYGQDADTGAAESRAFLGRMEQSQQGLRGSAGLRFTGVTTQHSANLALLGKQFAEQAYRAVRGEQAIVSADTDAFTAQQPVISTVDSQTSVLNRPIQAA